MPPPSQREEDLVRLVDIRNAAASALSHARNMTFPRFLKSRKTMAAVEREMEIAGEAAGNLSETLLEACPSHHWKGLIDMRVILAHRYGDVDSLIVWNTLRQDYPGLVELVDVIISGMTSQTNR